jgi:lipoprotein-anchoring transpeptidase ErfK/SrfK
MLKNLLLSRHNILEAVGKLPVSYLFVDTIEQELHLVSKISPLRTYAVSTSQFGVGNRENSNKTPPGVHFIKEKIGHNAPAGRIFKSRIDTGMNYDPYTRQENLICTRILRLEGLQPGINKGTGIDSYQRYIYIHGTNREKDIGTPISHGCVCMKNLDIIELFNIVKENTIVVII